MPASGRFAGAMRAPRDRAGTAMVVLIAAIAANGVIGRNGKLPWRLPEDLRRFRALTTGHAVIMGRRTWESLPHALPDRQNIVVTRQAGYQVPAATTASSVEDALRQIAYPPPAFVIGGGELYRAALPYAQGAFITEIARAFDGDATFPALDRREWVEKTREPHVQEGPQGFSYAFVTYERI